MQKQKKLYQNKNIDFFTQKQLQILCPYSKYQILSHLSQGQFSIVLEIRNKQTKQIYALKIVKNSEGIRTRQGLICKMLMKKKYKDKKLQHLIMDSKFIVKIHDVFQTRNYQKFNFMFKEFNKIPQINGNNNNLIQQKFDDKSSLTNILMQLYSINLQSYIQKKLPIDNFSLKMFTYQMLRSLMFLHSKNICHRDIKPQNFLIRKYFLVLSDFGSAKFIHKQQKPSQYKSIFYVGSRYYRAPQLLLGYQNYDTKVDMWSVGCIMAELVLGRPIFRGNSTIDQLIKILRLIGTPDWKKIRLLGQRVPKLPQIKPKGINSIFNSHKVPELFTDLMGKLLIFNPQSRFSAAKALCHQYFDDIRDHISFNEINKQIDITHLLHFQKEELIQNEHLKNKLIPAWTLQNQTLQKLKKQQNIKIQQILRLKRENKQIKCQKLWIK